MIFDLVGTRSFGDLLRALAPSGTLVMGSGDTEKALGPVDRMLTGYEQDDDVTVLVLHVPRRDGGASAGEGDITSGAGRTSRA